jgi:hypothetical protein
VLLRMTYSVVAIAMRRKARASETGRCTVLYPAGGGVGVGRGVGVAPAIPTLGDRRASGHSIIGRCWSRGRLLAWLADS